MILSPTPIFGEVYLIQPTVKGTDYCTSKMNIKCLLHAINRNDLDRLIGVLLSG